VVAFDVAYNRETTENVARFFDSTLTLHLQLDRLTEAECNSMRVSLENIASKRYTWGRIADLYAQLFGEDKTLPIVNLTSEASNRNEEIIQIKTQEREEVAA
jgi:hypothetical protein